MLRSRSPTDSVQLPMPAAASSRRSTVRTPPATGRPGRTTRQSAEALITILEADMRPKDTQLAQAESHLADHIAAEQARAQRPCCQGRTRR